MTPEDFLAWTRTDGECWLWAGAVSAEGYGRLGDRRYAHRVAHELFIGPIPDGCQVDHLCRVRLCCRPEHLEAVTQAENVRRQPNVADRLARTHCPRGHPYDEANTRVRPTGRSCKRCNDDRVNRYRRLQRAERRSARQQQTTDPRYSPPPAGWADADGRIVAPPEGGGPVTAATTQAALVPGYYHAGSPYQVTESPRGDRLTIRYRGAGPHVVATLTGRGLEWRTGTPWIRAQVAQLVADPGAARAAYAFTTGRCWRCSRRLTDPDSAAAGIGDDCRAALAKEPTT